MSKSIARVVDLIDDPKIIAKYEEYHRNAWPEVLEKLKASGVERMEIFRNGNHLFMYTLVSEDIDPEHGSRRYEGTARNKEWNDIMTSYMQKVPEAPEMTDGSKWHQISQVFDSDWFANK